MVQRKRRGVSVAVAALIVSVGMTSGAQAAVRILSSSGGVTATPVGDNAARLLGWTDDGADIWFARHGRAFRIPATGGHAVAAPSLDGVSQVGPGGRSAIVRRFPASATLRAADGRQIAKLAPWDPSSETLSEYVAWSRDGRLVAVAVDDRLLVLDADSGAAVSTIPLPGIDAYTTISPQAFAPDGSALVVLADNEVLRADVASRSLTTVASLPDDHWDPPAWSTSGAISVTGWHHHLVVVGSPTIPIGAWVYPAQWTPDGGNLTYSEWTGGGASGCDSLATLTTVAPGAPARHLIALDGWIDAWAWSADSQRVAIGFRRRIERRGKRHPWPRKIPRSFEMFTRSGDAAVRKVVVRVAVGLRHGARRATSMGRLATGLDRIRHRHPEVQDSAVEEAIAVVVGRWLHAAGFRGIGGLDELDSC